METSRWWLESFWVLVQDLSKKLHQALLGSAVSYCYSCFFGFVEAYLKLRVAGVARSKMDTIIPWLLDSDLNLTVLVGDSKQLKCLADISCDLATSSGVTELTVVDHDIVQSTEAKMGNHGLQVQHSGH